MALLALAGMRSLPRDPFEAAAVDGAGYWYTFRKLMLPMLWPYILVAVIFRFMDSLKMFDVIYALTRGGPGDSMMVLQVRGYQEAILYTNFSVGLTYTIVIWAAVFIATRLLVEFSGVLRLGLPDRRGEHGRQRSSRQGSLEYKQATLRPTCSRLPSSCSPFSRCSGSYCSH